MIVLREFSHTLAQTRQTIRKVRGKRAGFSPKNIPFTPIAKRILAQAFNESRQQGSRYVNPEHIFLALIGDSNTAAAIILNQQKINIDQLRIILI